MVPVALSTPDFIGDFPGQQKLIVLDDLMEKASNRPDVVALFTHGRNEHVSVKIMVKIQCFDHNFDKKKLKIATPHSLFDRFS